ncbi:MAG: coiled-coil domain-containing protein, partial [Candidatus Xenobia bacterium]
YFINNTPCRLKDIHELFMGTGLGHGAIAILGQREIQMVLSQDAQERKIILEEAAGVMKYKVRKKEALRRLEATHDNVLRIKDIHREVEANLVTAGQQLEQYHKYMATQTQLRQLSKDLIIWETVDLREQKQSLIKKGADDEEKIAALESQLQAAAVRLSTAREAEESHDRARDEAQQRLSDLSVDMERSTGRGAVLEERERALLREREQRRQALETLVLRGDQLETEAQQLKERREMLAVECQAAATELDARRDDERRITALLQQDMPRHAEAEQKLQGLQRSRAVIRERLNSLEERTQRATTRLEEIADQRKKLEDDESSFGRVVKTHNEATQAVHERLKTEEAELQKLRGLRQKLDEQVEKVARRYEQVEDTYHQKSSRLAALRDLETEMAGHGAGVRLILAEPSKFPGVLGLVSDLVHVQGGQEMAFEAALGSHLSDMITESTDDARRCIEFLKQARAGRVTFWPLDLRRGQNKGKPYLPNLPGIVGWAPDLVGYEPRFDPVVQALLGRTVVMETLPHAVKVYDVLVKEGRFIPTLVTLDGEVMAAGGSISGGFNKTGRHGILSRKRERQELEEATAALKNEFSSLKERRKSLDDELKSLRFKGEEVRNRLLGAQREAAEADSKIAGVKARLHSLVDDRARLAREEQRALEDQAQAGESRTRLQTDLQNLEAEEQTLAEVVRELGGERDKLRQERDRIAEELQEHRIKWARLQQSLQEIDQALTTTAPRRDELEEEQETLRKSLEETVRAVRELDREREVWEAETAAYQEQLKAIKNRVAELDAQTEAVGAAVTQCEQEVETLKSKHGGLHEKVQVRRVQLAAMDEKIETSLARLTEIDMTPEDVDWDTVVVGDRNAVRKAQNELSNTLKNFGPVNLGAVEDYERLQERNEFLRSQLDDLQNAQADIMKAIQEMDETSARLLQETFKQVNHWFGEL